MFTLTESTCLTHELQHPGRSSDSASDVLSVVYRAGRKKARQDSSDDVETELTKEARKARAAEAKERKKAEAAAEKERKKLHKYSQHSLQDGGVDYCIFVSGLEWVRREQEKAAKLAAKEVQKQEKQKEKIENRASKGTCIRMPYWLSKTACYAALVVIVKCDCGQMCGRCCSCSHVQQMNMS